MRLVHTELALAHAALGARHAADDLVDLDDMVRSPFVPMADVLGELAGVERLLTEALEGVRRAKKLLEEGRT